MIEQGPLSALSSELRRSDLCWDDQNASRLPEGTCESEATAEADLETSPFSHCHALTHAVESVQKALNWLCWGALIRPVLISFLILLLSSLIIHVLFSEDRLEPHVLPKSLRRKRRSHYLPAPSR